MEKRLKITLLLFGLAIGLSILHNAVYGIFGFEEPVFFTLSLLSALGFLIMAVYSGVLYFRKYFLRKK